jgi:hypothetical protein
MNRRSGIFASLLMLLTSGINVAVAQVAGAQFGLSAETDADDFTAIRLRAAGLMDLSSSTKYAGIAVQNTWYAQDGQLAQSRWRRNVPGIVGIWRNQDRDSLTGINAEFGVVKVGSRTRAVGDAVWSLRPAPATGVELLAAAGLVETREAIERGIGYSFWGVSVEQKLADRLTAVAMLAWQPFTDGNDRTHARARLVWDVLPEQGINLQARWRQYRSSRDGIAGAYFDPESYRQWLAVVGFRKRMDNWTASGALGAGRELIRNGDRVSKPAYLAELRLEKALAGDTIVAIHAGYNRSTGFANVSDYWYSSLGVSVTVPFR